jgi:mannose/cellobiose epimerase-like protein (N-acyl-D-glucosamine 2-epimerase family)
VFSHAYLLNGDPAFGRGGAPRPGSSLCSRPQRAPDGGLVRCGFVRGRDASTIRATLTTTPSCCFALAGNYRATHDAAAIQACRRDLAVDAGTRLADPRHGGFFEEFAPGRSEMKLPRRQNPHMHLLEALLALHVATAEKNWLRPCRRAGRPVQAALLRRGVRRARPSSSPPTGRLRQASPARLREPGHQFEWVGCCTSTVA